MRRCENTEKIAHAYNCPLAPSGKFGFLDDFARTRALPFIAAASADTEAQIKTCLDNTVPNTQFVRRYTAQNEFLKTKCGGFLAYSVIPTGLSPLTSKQLLAA